MNDYRTNALHDPNLDHGNIEEQNRRRIDERETRKNVQFESVLYKNMPYTVAIVVKDVAPNQELLVDYGRAYWDMVNPPTRM